MIEVFDFPQGSLDWNKARYGLPTASAMKQLFTASHTLPKSVTNTILTYAAELAADLSSGLPLSSEEGFQGNAITDRGHELEPIARRNYAFSHGVEVQEAGFITNYGAGCSPDGLIGSDGGLEIKCLLAKAHTRSVTDCVEGNCPSDYYVQIQTCMWICERSWWDLYFYHPHLSCKSLRVESDSKFQELLTKQTALITGERDRMIEALSKAAA